MTPIIEETLDGIVLAIPSDSLSGANVAGFRKELEGLARGPQLKVLVDLSLVQFIDSAACSALLQFHNQMQARGGRVVVCCASASVRALFELVRMQRVLDLYPSRDAALAALKG